MELFLSFTAALIVAPIVLVGIGALINHIGNRS